LRAVPERLQPELVRAGADMLRPIRLVEGGDVSGWTGRLPLSFFALILTARVPRNKPLASDLSYSFPEWKMKSFRIDPGLVVLFHLVAGCLGVFCPPAPGALASSLAGERARGVQFVREVSREEASFNHPEAVAVSPDGNLWVADTGSRLLKRISFEPLRIEQAGYADFELERPVDVWSDGVETLVLDSELERLAVLRAEDMRYVGSVEIPEETYMVGEPVKVCRDRLGRFLVARNSVGRVTILSEKGRYLGSFGCAKDGEAVGDLTCTSSGKIIVLGWAGSVCLFDQFGNLEKRIALSNLGEETEFAGLAVDRSGNLFLLDRGGCRVVVVGPDWKETFRFGGKGSGRGSFLYPGGIAIGEKGLLFVADTGNDRVQVFRVRYGSATDEN